MGKEKQKKQEKTEKELVLEYAQRVIDGKKSRGHIDKRFEYTKKEGTVNKTLWLDTDFFFSIVFQSSKQKYDFLKFLYDKYQIPLENEYGSAIQILNGLKLAHRMGLKLDAEIARNYPYTNIDLQPLILDNEATMYNLNTGD